METWLSYMIGFFLVFGSIGLATIPALIALLSIGRKLPEKKIPYYIWIAVIGGILLITFISGLAFLGKGAIDNANQQKKNK